MGEQGVKIAVMFGLNRAARVWWYPRGGVAALTLILSVLLGGCSGTKTFDFWPTWAPKESSAVPAPAAAEAVAPIAVTLSAGDFATQLGRSGLEDYEQQAITRLSHLAEIFYERLSHRRVNSIATFHDPALREFFQSPEAFADYYADLVQALDNKHFEANRPKGVGLESFAVEEGGDRVTVRVRFRGDNGLPLRFWSAYYTREDTWELSEQRWWIVPRKL